MRTTRLGFIALFTLGLAVLSGTESSRAGLKLAKWTHMAPILFETDPGDLPVRVPLTPEVHDIALPGLTDLRVVSEDGSELGYVLEIPKAGVHRVPLKTTLYNKTHVPGRSSSVTADFGENAVKNQVDVVTSGENFRRIVRIEASDDRVNWVVARDGAYILRVPKDRMDGTEFARTSVSFPDNNQRYLKITVFNSADDTGVVDISKVTAWRIVRTDPVTTEAPARSTDVKQKKKRTEVAMDLGYRNMPLYELRLSFSDPNFFRRVEVMGRNRETKIVKRVVEDSPALEKTVKEPWTPVSKGAIFRFTSKRGSEESLSVRLAPAKFRYLLIRIANGDNPPLGFVGAEVTRLIERLEFPKAKKQGLKLFLGNPKAGPPQYDVGRYLARLKEAGVVEARLGKVVPNSLHQPARPKLPWSERHKGIIWLALLVMIAVLGLLIYRMRPAPKSEE